MTDYAKNEDDAKLAGDVMTRLSVVEDKSERKKTLMLLVDMAHAYRVKPDLERELRSKTGSLQLARLLFVVLIVINAVTLLSGCAKPPREDATAPIRNSIPKPTRIPISDHNTNILIDQETGCEYIALYSKTMAPRMGIKNGAYQHLGCKEQ